MGLSDQERIRNIINCVNDLTDIQSFKENVNEPIWSEFNTILNDLWFDLIGGSGNSSHWFAGSSSDRTELDQSNVFGLAILQSYSADEPDQPSLAEQVSQDVDKTWGEGTKKWWNYTSHYRPTALSLLKKEDHNGYEEEKVYSIFKLTESYFYSVNRYKDNISESFTNLTKKISKLQGLCFKAISKDPIYFKAFAAEIVLYKILPDNVDFINNWFMNNCMHHNIQLDLINKDELFKAFKKAQLIAHDVTGMKFSANERVVLLLKFLGRRFHDDYSHKKLFKVIEEHNLNNKNDLIDLKNIKILCDKASLDAEVNKKENVWFWHCDLTNQSYYDLEDRKKKFNKKPKKK